MLIMKESILQSHAVIANSLHLRGGVAEKLLHGRRSVMTKRLRLIDVTDAFLFRTKSNG